MTTELKDDVETTRDGATLLVRFARPAKKNALTIAMYERLNAALAEAAADPGVRAVVFGSTSETFTAGNDLGDFMQDPPTGESSPVFRFIAALAAFEKPLLAAVDGKAIGVGLTMLLHCDFVYATERASFVTPFVNLGLVPEAGSSLLLPRLLGHVRAAEMLLLGQPISAGQAHAWGLVNALLPPDEVLPRALATAKLLSERAPTALKLSKRLMKDSAALKARMSEEGALFVERLQSAEVAEAIGAFFEKRTPDFSKL
ncbi:MAG: enoyl-CoA hydratase [Myxococcaceae bacterium]|jgi:enoyl-CoA hydratase/carnithine racemase|nr:enoyl-CoA hydratase [Myxococcaceae bacterium]MCA3016670.1 enoyl-CoA hydratase [Myxococcaceae bacterium]